MRRKAFDSLPGSLQTTYPLFRDSHEEAGGGESRITIDACESENW